MEEFILDANTRMQIGAANFNHPALTFLHDYWNRKRGSRNMPSRSDIVPSELRQYLPWILLADVLPEMKDFRYRLVGSLITSYFGTEGGGKTLREVFSQFGETTVRGILRVYRKAASGHVPVRLTGQADWNGKGLEAYETVYLASFRQRS